MLMHGPIKVNMNNICFVEVPDGIHYDKIISDRTIHKFLAVNLSRLVCTSVPSLVQCSTVQLVASYINRVTKLGKINLLHKSIVIQ